jgi:hypothetical protein
MTKENMPTPTQSTPTISDTTAVAAAPGLPIVPVRVVLPSGAGLIRASNHAPCVPIDTPL